MSRGRRSAAIVGLFFAVAMGCKTDKINTKVPHVEEFTPPPHEDRYDNPPEQGYKAPRPKKEFKPGMGGPGGPGGGMNGGQGQGF